MTGPAALCGLRETSQPSAGRGPHVLFLRIVETGIPPSRGLSRGCRRSRSAPSILDWSGRRAGGRTHDARAHPAAVTLAPAVRYGQPGWVGLSAGTDGASLGSVRGVVVDPDGVDAAVVGAGAGVVGAGGCGTRGLEGARGLRVGAGDRGAALRSVAGSPGAGVALGDSDRPADVEPTGSLGETPAAALGPPVLGWGRDIATASGMRLAAAAAPLPASSRPTARNATRYR